MIYSLKGDLNIHVVGSFTSRWSLLGEQEQDEEQNLPVYNNIFSKKNNLVRVQKPCNRPELYNQLQFFHHSFASPKILASAVEVGYPPKK